jgi:hypothetical protein
MFAAYWTMYLDAVCAFSVMPRSKRDHGKYRPTIMHPGHFDLQDKSEHPTNIDVVIFAIGYDIGIKSTGENTSRWLDPARMGDGWQPSFRQSPPLFRNALFIWNIRIELKQ